MVPRNSDQWKKTCEQPHKERSVQGTKWGPHVVDTVSSSLYSWDPLARTTGWWELVYECPSSLAPWVESPWSSSSTFAPGVHSGNLPVIGCLPCLLALPHSPTSVSWNHFPNSLLALELFSQVSFWDNPNQDILWGENHCAYFID